MKPRLLHLDENHPLLIENLRQEGFECEEDYYSSKTEIEKRIANYEGIILRSHFRIDKEFLQAGKKLKFIARVGSGLENIDTAFAYKKGIVLLHAPEGNCDAVGEHALGMLLCLMHRIIQSDRQIHQGKWMREANRGVELSRKTIAIIGYGHTGKAFARRLSSLKTKTLCYDILEGIGDTYARQTSWEEIFQLADVLSLHVPLTELTKNIINHETIQKFKKSFYLINTARGDCLSIEALTDSLKSGKILGAGLDVLPYEKSSFESLFEEQLSDDFHYLCHSEKVVLTPHIAGWSQESKYKLARCIFDKIICLYKAGKKI
ncbi:NAD(P)-dependent oxidoreductase [Bacteroidetes bacterium endosymbiont of Geopemphigus sp.]|uniref:NAD(P)-dependent oxidoreductase n=1 Tax=Bacteroidetes bacterium endosymbiont of Geopemphigus sp. TaxID=2047937 RepID=UPI000CD2E8C5|nr:NAD(P)-dependent oxidoreductase [Bacteroidetes bacterium endosymbiont of Geopemphigus sp.]